MTHTIGYVERIVTRESAGRSTETGWRLSLKFEPRDVWVGLYWDRRAECRMLDVYVCLVPMLPLHLRWWRLG